MAASESKTLPIKVTIFDVPNSSKVHEATLSDNGIKVADVISFEYIETIYDQFCKARLTVMESSGVFEKSFNGCGVRPFCMVAVEFNDPLKDTDDTTRKRKSLTFAQDNFFFIKRINAQLVDKKKQLYEFELIGKDSLSSMIGNITSTWPSNDSTNIETNYIIKEILKQWIYTKKTDFSGIDSDKSIVQTKVNGNGQQPYQLIQYLCRVSSSLKWSKVGSKTESSATGYLFFDTYSKYRFTSIASLINLDQGEQIPESHKYIVSIANDSQTTPKEQAYRIISYKFNEGSTSTDLIQQIRSASKGKKQAFVLDQARNVFKKVETLNPVLDKCQTSIADGSFVTNVYIQDQYNISYYNSCENNLKNAPTAVSLNSLNYGALIEQLKRQNSVIRINGNLDISAGDKMYIQVPEIKGDGKNATQVSNKYSGIYVVTKVAHRLENYKFIFTDLEIVKIVEPS